MMEPLIEPGAWTVRDLFAAFAAAGMHANVRSREWTHEEIATDAFFMADLMMEVRKRQ